MARGDPLGNGDNLYANTDPALLQGIASWTSVENSFAANPGVDEIDVHQSFEPSLCSPDRHALHLSPSDVIFLANQSLMQDAGMQQPALYSAYGAGNLTSFEHHATPQNTHPRPTELPQTPPPSSSPRQLRPQAAIFHPSPPREHRISSGLALFQHNYQGVQPEYNQHTSLLGSPLSARVGYGYQKPDPSWGAQYPWDFPSRVAVSAQAGLLDPSRYYNPDPPYVPSSIATPCFNPRTLVPITPERQKFNSWDAEVESPTQAGRLAPPTPISDRRFSRRSSLATTTATGSSHSCPSEGCERTFPSPSALAHHQRYHDGARKHVCSICANRFLFLKDLKRHFRIHGQERHIFCNIAGCKYQHEGFYRKDHLKRHMKTHLLAPPATPSSHSMSRQASDST